MDKGRRDSLVSVLSSLADQATGAFGNGRQGAKTMSLEEQALEVAAPDQKSKAGLIFCFFVFLFTPGSVLFATGVMERGDCTVQSAKCVDWCTTTYDDDDRVYQTDFEGERQCVNRCLVEEQTCRQQGFSVIFGGLTLGLGLVAASLLVLVLDALSRRYGGASDVLDISRPRPAYFEPSFTEEEKMKKNKGKILMTPATCCHCGASEPVEYRWKTCEKGGMEGAICPRCKQVILGVL